MNNIEEIIKVHRSFDTLIEDNGAFGRTSNEYQEIISLHKGYEIDVLRDLQRAVDEAKKRSKISKELNKLDRHYSPKVVSRVKSLDSIYQKLISEQISWKDLPLDDTLGYRLVCRFLDETFELRDLLEVELNKPPFEIISRFPRDDSGNWANKVEDSGYRSFDFAFLYRRSELNIELEGELQLRTILQHAWAEVSHDTFYKNNELNKLPEYLTKGSLEQMHIISDILEAADRSFVELRKTALSATNNFNGGQTNS